MKPDQPTYHRRSIRLDGFDYSQNGAYFVTLVTFQRQCLLGKVLDGQMVLSSIGKIVREEWFSSANIRKEIHLDAEDFIVMPNHIHGVVQFVGAQGLRPISNSGGRRPPLQRKPQSLSSFIAGFKSSATKRAIAFDGTIAGSIWQRNYYEHIIRNQNDLENIYKYIQFNPIQWTKDEENPEWQNQI